MNRLHPTLQGKDDILTMSKNVAIFAEEIHVKCILKMVRHASIFVKRVAKNSPIQILVSAHLDLGSEIPKWVSAGFEPKFLPTVNMPHSQSLSTDELLTVGKTAIYYKDFKKHI